MSNPFLDTIPPEMRPLERWHLCFATRTTHPITHQGELALYFTPAISTEVTPAVWDHIPYAPLFPATAISPLVLTWFLPSAPLRDWYLPNELYQPVHLSVNQINAQPVPWLTNTNEHHYLYPDYNPVILAEGFHCQPRKGRWTLNQRRCQVHHTREGWCLK